MVESVEEGSRQGTCVLSVDFLFIFFVHGEKFPGFVFLEVSRIVFLEVSGIVFFELSGIVVLDVIVLLMFSEIVFISLRCSSSASASFRRASDQTIYPS